MKPTMHTRFKMIINKHILTLLYSLKILKSVLQYLKIFVSNKNVILRRKKKNTYSTTWCEMRQGDV